MSFQELPPIEIYPNIDQEILELSTIHVFVLQRMAQLSKPVVRYQVMKDIRQIITELSTAKFYRILDTLAELNFVDSAETNDQKLFYITKRGRRTITILQEFINQPGLHVLEYFSSHIDDLLKFSLNSTQNLLIADPEGFVEFPFIKLLADQVDYIDMILTEKAERWLKTSIKNLEGRKLPTSLQDTQQKRYDTIILYFPSEKISMDKIRIYHSLLEDTGQLVIFESEPVNPKHFVLKILYNAFAPKLYRDKEDPTFYLRSIETQFDWKTIKKIEFDKLLGYKYCK